MVEAGRRIGGAVIGGWDGWRAQIYRLATDVGFRYAVNEHIAQHSRNFGQQDEVATDESDQVGRAGHTRDVVAQSASGKGWLDRYLYSGNLEVKCGESVISTRLDEALDRLSDAGDSFVRHVNQV